MNAHPKKSWVLSDRVTEAVQRLMDEGRVSGLDEVVQMGLAIALEEPDPEETEWFRRDVLPVIEEMERHPERAIPLEQAWAELEADIAKRRGEG